MIHCNNQYNESYKLDIKNTDIDTENISYNLTYGQNYNLDQSYFSISKNPTYKEYSSEDEISSLSDYGQIYENEPNKKIYHFTIKKPIKIKRGRKGNKNINENSYSIHDKNTSDNILRKIQVHYISFIISFANEILLNFNYKKKFRKLAYNFKKNVKKSFCKSLKTKDIGEIIIHNPISDKYKLDKGNNENENINFLIYNQIKKNEILRKIFSENYLILFRKIYYPSRKKINLREYGIDKNIVLSDKVEMFEDLLKKIELSDSKEEYKKKVYNCVIKNFLPTKKFKII